ncbi:MAG TPA: hypothetical protein DCP91_04690 [Eggerthellaceae bacterium]|nr:hypothetical protein [Eggerthellaceae bacterium]
MGPFGGPWAMGPFGGHGTFRLSSELRTPDERRPSSLSIIDSRKGAKAAPIPMSVTRTGSTSFDQRSTDSGMLFAFPHEVKDGTAWR